MILILRYIKELQKESDITSCLRTQQIVERRNIAGPSKIGDRCHVNTNDNMCQERFNFALCINEKCECFTGHHFVNETRTCVKSRGMYSRLLFYIKEKRDDRLRLLISVLEEKKGKSKNSLFLIRKN